jgi:hypothetical protein
MAPPAQELVVRDGGLEELIAHGKAWFAAIYSVVLQAGARDGEEISQRTKTNAANYSCRGVQMPTTTRNRVPRHTSPDVNRRIQQEIESSIRYYQQHRMQISLRLQELDEEWDIERAIQANAAGLAFAGVALGVLSNRRWLLLPALVTGFLFQHAVEGWCPPIPILRRLGFRTAHEIEQERQALKLLRGDYRAVADGGADAEALMQAVKA